MAEKNFVVVTTVDRETTVLATETLEQAQELMKQDFDEFCKSYNTEEDDETEMGEDYAWVNLACGCHYDISIHKI